MRIRRLNGVQESWVRIPPARPFFVKSLSVSHLYRSELRFTECAGNNSPEWLVTRPQITMRISRGRAASINPAPPSTAISWPVIQLAPSEHSKATAFLISAWLCAESSTTLHRVLWNRFTPRPSERWSSFTCVPRFRASISDRPGAWKRKSAAER